MSLDLVVAGGGPVGLATALYAVRAGMSVAVLEPRPGAVDKACGEGLMPGTLAGLQRLGVDPPGHDLAGIRYLRGARTVTADFARAGRGVRRTVLHAALREAVGHAGVPVLRAALTGVSQDASGVTVDARGERSTLRARYVVGADGLHSPTRRVLGLDRPAARHRRHGLRQHYRLAPWSDHVEVHWADRSEAYVTPVDDDTVGVAVLTRVTGPLEDQLAVFDTLAARLQGAPVASATRGAGPLRQRVRSRADGRVLLVGDAGGYVDALTGEGLALGLAQAQAAVDALAADRPEGYPAAAARVGLTSTALTHGLLAATRTRTGRRLVLGAATLVPPVFGLAVGALARTGPTADGSAARG